VVDATPDVGASIPSFADLASDDAEHAAVAHDHLIRTYYALLCDSAESYLGDRLAAEEVTDAVFARIWDRRRELQIRTTIAAYLFGAVRNAARNVVAKRRFAERRGAEAMAGAEPPGMGSGGAAPGTAVEEEELRTIVWTAVAALPERARAILTLRWRMQLEWREIADALSMTVNAAQVQHTRALAQLRRRLSWVADIL